MATVDTHAPGSFCWIELGTTDQNAAKQFYSRLLGWTAEDFPMGPNEVYTMFSLDGRNTAGCYNLTPDMTAHGLPPHWLLYIAVVNADETVAKITRAGGSIMKPAFDVMEFGRMAVCQDPSGAAFAVWPILDMDIAMMAIENRADNRQPKTAMFAKAVPLRSHAVEAPEDGFALVGRNAGAIILHGDFRHFVLPDYNEPNPATLR